MLNSEVEHAGLSKREIIHLICFRFTRFNLLALADFLDDEKFVQFIDRFAGTYIKVPPATKLFEAFDEYRLFVLHLQMKKLYAARDMDALHQVEKQFLQICKRLHIKYETGRKTAAKVEQELAEATQWLTGMRDLQERQDKAEVRTSS